MKNLAQTCLFFFLFLFYLTSNAQLEVHHINGEVWAKGDLVEIGINSKGVFGANNFNRPITFHDNREDGRNNLFGFIANPLDDGWIDYDGDFFTPGSPEEGFTIEIDGINYSNNNVDNLFELPGEIKDTNIISSNCDEDTAKILWEGSIQGLNIKRYYSITKKGLFIKMETIIENRSSNAKNNVFFMHNVDPDNNVTLSKRYETDMVLLSQANSNTDNICLVTASQKPLYTSEDMDGSKISFYANEPNARVTFGGFSNRSASDIWNGTADGYTNTQGAMEPETDRAISIAFKLNTIEPSEVITFTYYYVLEGIDQTFEPVVIGTTVEHPNTCGGDEGKIILSGLIPNESYSINYEHDGTQITGIVFTSDLNGNLEILNLTAGNYSNIELDLNGCKTYVGDTIELKDPELPSYSFEKSDLTNCTNIDGEIKIIGLDPLTNYTYQYNYNSTSIAPINSTTNSNGELVLSHLAGGTYTNFTIEKYNNCVTESNETIELISPDGPSISTIPEQFYCDDDDDYITTINLSDLNSFFLGTDSASEYEMTYHESEIDALSNIALPATNYVTSGSNSYTVYAKKTSLINNCFSYVPFIITVKTPIEFSINSEILCLNSNGSINNEYDLPIISTGLSEVLYDFEWYYEGQLIPGEILSDLIVSDYGDYSVTVTDIAANCTASQTTTITPSGPPEILNIDIISPPFSNNHTVEIIANGYGDYIYTIDNGVYQTSPLFSGISSGHHIFSVKDINGCGIAHIEETVIDYLHHFSPNNDGNLDYWKVNTENLINPEIYIFDRKGKLLKQLNPNSIGWNGKHQNKNLPTSDYWFKVIYTDDNNNRKEFMANFTLKR